MYKCITHTDADLFAASSYESILSPWSLCGRSCPLPGESIVAAFILDNLSKKDHIERNPWAGCRGGRPNSNISTQVTILINNINDRNFLNPDTWVWLVPQPRCTCLKFYNSFLDVIHQHCTTKQQSSLAHENELIFVAEALWWEVLEYILRGKKSKVSVPKCS